MSKTLHGLVIVTLIASLFPSAADASRYANRLRGKNVGLGLAAGFQLPSAEAPISASGAWGFYTDIPLLRTFHLSPSTILYRLDREDGSRDIAAADVSMNFKFIVPLQRLNAMAGVTTGVTSTDKTVPHMGVVGGVSFKIVSNLYFFIHANYRYVLDDTGVIHGAQFLCGPLFKFTN
jgi:hypothetical protein